jgi:NAD(P)-dependent dehydrogenase (short-subunit alcohol dehydrogenase family)
MTDRGLFSMEGRNVLVTGAARGLGAAMSLALAGQGANVAVFDSAEGSSTTVPAEIEQLGPRSMYIQGDVTRRSDCDAAVAAVVKDWGGLDVLVNNAGIALNGPAETISMDDVQRVFDIDVFGMLACSQAAFSALRTSRHAAVINIASMAGLVVLRPQKHIGYNAAKAAVVMLTKTLAIEWAEAGIRVNAIAPGYMTSPAVELLRAERPGDWESWMEAVPLKRAGEPSELGGAAVFLASDASSYVTGAVLVVDGGYTSV